jgi:hypothetical protein
MRGRIMTKQISPDDAFVAYVTAAEIAGTERGACATVAKQFGVPRSTITRMRDRYRWSARLAGEVAPLVRQKTNEFAATSAAEWRAESARVGGELVRKGFAALEAMQVLSPSDALAAIKLGASMVDKATEPNQKRIAVDVVHVLKERFERFVTPAPVARRIQVDFGSLDDDLKEGNGDE